MTNRRRTGLSIVAALIAALVAGCGSSGASDRGQIAAIVKQEGSDPATLCNHLTDGLLSQLGGLAGCMRQAATSPTDPTTRAKSVSVHRGSATAVVVNRAGTRTVDFVKERDRWKVSGIG
jgi:type IV pilus biogenesis protein CpaD/CtpE